MSHEQNVAPSYRAKRKSRDAALHGVENGLEVLGNLIYLTVHEASHQEKVCLYMEIAQTQMRDLNVTFKILLGP